MSELSSQIVQTAKQKIAPATVIDVLGGVCSVQLSGSGKVLKNLVYYGPKPAVGDSVLVDYKTGIPTVTTAGGTAVQQIIQTTINTSGGGSQPSNPLSPTDHNSLSGIQGGQDGEYFHLTANQLANMSGSVSVETTDDDKESASILRFNAGALTNLATGKWAIGSGLNVSDATPTNVVSAKGINFAPIGRISNNNGVVTVNLGMHVTDGTTPFSGVDILQFGAGLATNPSGNTVLIKDFWQAIGATRTTTTITLPTGTGVMAFGTAAARGTISNEDATYFLWAGNATAASAPFAIKANGGAVIKKGNISLGTGDAIVRISDDTSDNWAFWIGAAAAAGAPFRVKNTGEAWLTNMHFTIGDLESPDFNSGVRGWALYQNGNAELNNVVLRGKINSTVFAKETISGISGQMVVTVAALLTADVAKGDTAITVEDDVFKLGDVLHLKAANDTYEGTREEWMYVTNAGTIVMDGYNVVGYSYPVTRDMEADGADHWYIGESVFRDGNATQDPSPAMFGENTARFGDMTFGGNAYKYCGGQLVLYGEDDYGPYFGVNRRIGTAYEQTMHSVRMGNLLGFLDITTDNYGIGIGDLGRYLRYTYEDGLKIVTAEGGTTVDENGITTNSLNINESNVPNAFVDNQATLYVYNDQIIVHYNGVETVLNKLNGLAPVLQNDQTADRVIQLTLNGAVVLTASDMASVRIPACMEGFNLIGVNAHCGKDLTTGASSSGSVVISVQNNVTDMLSTNLQIDASQYDSSNSVTPAAINTSYDDIHEGNMVNVEIVSAGTGVTYLIVTLVFRKPTV